MDAKPIREWLRQLIVDRDRAIDGGSGGADAWQAASSELFPRDKPPRHKLYDAAVASLVASDKPIAPTMLQDMRTLRETHERYLRAELDQYDEDGVPSEYDLGDLMHAFGQDFERVRSMLPQPDEFVTLTKAELRKMFGDCSNDKLRDMLNSQEIKNRPTASIQKVEVARSSLPPGWEAHRNKPKVRKVRK